MLYDRALADKATAAGARRGTVLAPAATGIAYEDASGSPYLGKNCASVRECVRPQQPFALLAIAGLTTATAPRASRPLCKQCSAWRRNRRSQRAGNVCSQGRCGLCRTDKPAADNRGIAPRAFVSMDFFAVLTRSSGAQQQRSRPEEADIGVMDVILIVLLLWLLFRPRRKQPPTPVVVNIYILAAPEWKRGGGGETVPWRPRVVA